MADRSNDELNFLMMASDSDEMKFLSIVAAEEKDRFLKAHPHLATETTGKWYLMLAETRIGIYTDYPSAIRWAGCAEAIGKAIGDYSLEAEALCVSGEALLKLREGKQAEEKFHQAISVATSDATIRSRAHDRIRAAASLQATRSLASEHGPLGQLLSITDDKIAAARYVGLHPYLRQPSVLMYCLQSAESSSQRKEWDKAAQYARAAHIIARAVGAYDSSIRAACLCGDALVQIDDLADAASEYFGAITASLELKEDIPPDVKVLVSHAREAYFKLNSGVSIG